MAGTSSGSTGPLGLTEAEAARRLSEEGPNEVTTARDHGAWSLAWEVVSEPMIALLLVAGMVYLFLGEPRDAAVLLASIAIIVGVTIHQERKTERALESLRRMADPWAQVLREGQRRRIPCREVVRGDRVLLNEGERVPADVLLVEGDHLEADESLLTGESIPVPKEPGGMSGGARPQLFANTLVVRGSGVAEVVATGPRTEFGKIGERLSTLRPEPTRLQQDSRHLVRGLGVAALITIVSVAALSDLRFSSWVQGLLAGVTLAMALIPEEIPIMLTIFLALGAWRISRAGVLTRRFEAIEGLGSTTVLCVDKTGTLTENRMRLEVVEPLGELPVAWGPQVRNVEGARVVRIAALACDPDPVDPMEKALLRSERDLGSPERSPEPRHLRSYPLRSDHLWVTHVWLTGGGDGFLVAAKGAPESISELCHLSDSETQRVLAEVGRMGGEGLRVLAVARATLPSGGPLPGSDEGLRFELLGLVGLRDPLRPDVPRAVRALRRAGIRVLMITGDHPTTARSIARQAGLPLGAEVLTGPQIALLREQELGARLGHVSVCARVRPEQKLSVVRALQHAGEVVTMTGDGVNDAPALRASTVGIAMGERGTDVAREAASLVLLSDSFPAIVGAVREGRTIYDNLRKAVVYLLAVHVPLAGIAFLPVLLGLPLVLFPVHILFLEFIIDPTVTVVFEAEPPEPDTMDRPPRDPKASLYGGGTLRWSLTLGFSALAGVAALFLLMLASGRTEDVARTTAFVALVSSNLALMLVSRSRTESLRTLQGRRNPYLRTAIAAVVMALAAALYVPAVSGVFRFVPLSPGDLLIGVGAGLLSGGWYEPVKAWRGRSLPPARMGLATLPASAPRTGGEVARS
ncbi:MAG: cation-translocating P-type ATPase [Euryarchaeota archaeon]|nr:cation-translocating P-type ATPase [Euryarchaeota archaeon]MDE1835109.1 cation-translocating P-type ATPase [Euryarchaeota archaeon]MDE1880705.1 cation-translocating P-type ATPase [Euryarchaeota archaeon]MDE2044928.1 cation-translocating P-type ATPase [Thermoplasmata archaeon]